jgi:hypothetical protein
MFFPHISNRVIIAAAEKKNSVTERRRGNKKTPSGDEGVLCWPKV